MKRVLATIPVALLAVALLTAGCGGDSGSSCSASVCNPQVGTGYDGNSATGVGSEFGASTPAFHVTAKLNGVADGTTVTGVLVGIDSGTETEIATKDVEISGGAGNGVVHFTWSKQSDWTPAKYRTDIKIGGSTQASVTWTVK